MAEHFGAEGRGSFYDPVGAMRDVVQNHLLQLLALVAMEPPVGRLRPRPDPRQEARPLQGDPAADPGRCVRGQYEGYLEVEGVAPDSNTETFCALRLAVENWRWAGVPFFLRAGKCLEAKVTEIRVDLQEPARASASRAARPPRPTR